MTVEGLSSSSLCSFLRTLIWPNVPFPSPVVLFQKTFISPPTMPNSFQVHVSLKESDGAEEYDWCVRFPCVMMACP